MNTTLDKLIGALRQAGLEFDAEDLADALWFAPFLPHSPADPLRVQPPVENKTPEQPLPPQKKKKGIADKKQPPTDHVSDTVGQAAVDAQLPGVRGKDSTQGSARGLPVRLPGAASLPEALGIARALRPLRKRIATTRWFRLDEKRTAERLAAVDIWLPVVSPGRERWLNATIIVDTGASMAIWRSMVNEFRGILQSLGAFRKLEVRRMDTDDPGESVPIFASGQATARHDPLDLADPSGRSFFLIISDCVGSAWWDGRVAQLLEQWGRTNHTAVLQILPRTMWGRTALGAERTVNLTSPQAVCPNTNLAAFATGKFRRNVKLDIKNMVPVPVLELGAASLATWARDATSATGAQFSGRLLRTRPAPAPVVGEDHWSQAIGEPFLTVASLPARKLANLMAAAPPFNLPLLRVIRESRLSGEATQIHEAEFLLGGLLTVVSNENDTDKDKKRVDDPDSVIYDFKTPELRAMLRSAVHVSEAIEVMSLEEVGDYLGSRVGRLNNFSGIMRAPQDYAGTLDLAPTEDSNPFARFTSDMLRWFGGKYSELLSAKSDQQQRSFEWDDQRNVVWYGYGDFEDGTKLHASAVAIRLQRDGVSPRTYLITCAHLVSSSMTDLFPTTLRAWRGGTPFSLNHGQPLRVIAIRSVRPAEQVADNQFDTVFSWVLLEITDEPAALVAPAVRLWANPNISERIRICGYQSDSVVTDSTVTPKISDGHSILPGSDRHILILEGDDSDRQLSGAGLFDANGGFVGILYSQPLADSLIAIPAGAVSESLKELGFHVASDEATAELTPVAELAEILGSEEFRVIDWQETLNQLLQQPSTPSLLEHITSKLLRWLNRALPQSSSHSSSKDPADDESLADALLALAEESPNEHGLHQLYEFAIKLHRLKSVEALHNWIDRHVPLEVRKSFEETEANGPNDEEPTRPDVSVLVAGTGSYDLPSAVYEAAERVGGWAAHSGFGLVTGGWQGVDHVAAREFAKSLDHGRPIKLWLTHLVRTGTGPDFKHGGVIEVGTDHEWYTRAAELTRAVTLVGGLGGTWIVAMHAVQIHVPVFPLPWTGGDAAKFYHHVLANWDEYEWMGMPQGRFEALSNPSQALDIIAEHLRPTHQDPKPTPLPSEPGDTTRMLFFSSRPQEGSDIRTNEELATIAAALQPMSSRDLIFDFQSDLTWDEFRNWLAFRKPVFLHFCGYVAHGRLVFREASGGAKHVDPEAFADALGTSLESPRVIVLNADGTEPFAKRLSDKSPDRVVIATKWMESEDEAIRFAKDFYGQLAEGNSVREAYMHASQTPTKSSSGGTYSLWSNAVDPWQLTVKSGFIELRTTTIKNELEDAIKQSMAVLHVDAHPDLLSRATRRLGAARQGIEHDRASAIVLGRLHRELTELQRAIWVLTSAIEANANRADSSEAIAHLLYDRASYHAILEESEEAFADLSRSLCLSPRWAENARENSDFKSLHGDRRFAVLLDNPRPHRVLIVGSDKERSGPQRVSKEFDRYCKDLGSALARAGFGFVLGSYSQSTADHYVLEGIAEVDVPVSIAYIRPRFEQSKWHLEEVKLAGHFVEREQPDADWPTVRPMQVHAADIVVAIGGRDGTEQVIDITRNVGKPLISVPSFPGAARIAWPSVRQTLAKNGLGLPLIERLNHGFDTAAVVEAIQFCLSGPHRDPSGLLSIEEIRSELLRSGLVKDGDQITGELLLSDEFEGLQQRVWLVATLDEVFFLLDDEKTRAENDLVQWKRHRGSLLPISFDAQSHTIIFGPPSNRRSSSYSATLFPTRDELEAAVQALLGSGSSSFIWLIMSPADYESATKTGTWDPRLEGEEFINAVPSDQLTRAANKHYSHLSEVRVVPLRAEKILSRIEWEPASGGNLYPHIYGPINFDAAEKAFSVRQDAEGRFEIVVPPVRAN